MLSLQTLSPWLLATILAAASGGPQSGVRSPSTGTSTANDCLIIGPNPVCALQQLTYSSAFAGTNYSWSITQTTAGAFFCGPTNQQSVCVSTTQAGFFRLQLDYVLQSGPKTCAVEISVHDALTISDLEPQDVCSGSDATFSTTVLTGNSPYTFVWTVDKGSGAVVIPGANTNVLTLTNVSASDAGKYCVSVTNECGSVQSCADLTVENCGGEEFCTFTQGAYGTAGGSFNGVSTLDLLTQLLATDLTVGKSGRSLTIPAGIDGAECVMSRLPANSTPGTLPAFGDALLLPDVCQTSPTALPLKNGKFKNVLLGQTITLALNTRFDTDLSDLVVCESMTTQLINAGPDGIFHTADDQADPGKDGIFGTADDVLTVHIPPSVMSALATLGLPPTVGGILELANRALAAQSTGGATISDVNNAVNAINVGFDECRFLIGCTNP